MLFSSFFFPIFSFLNSFPGMSEGEKNTWALRMTRGRSIDDVADAASSNNSRAKMDTQGLIQLMLLNQLKSPATSPAPAPPAPPAHGYWPPPPYAVVPPPAQQPALQQPYWQPFPMPPPPAQPTLQQPYWPHIPQPRRPE